ncbi:hypothetical protein HBI56_004490 [Parastagonospora nodorum]|uniref:Uncharacterized protein n=1 Tax=Phaeosphaeria nodorum (strain SN15 / ATCC MYA-4574 / FGSC 10173) TaxID=321614 RepID=A0A7U2EQN3_PHANO|nr:hypothetical protein HBH56_136560 [Parastagonospora nodorum]QRC91269.1 hypothetical protein JI435_401150 [Parastagonospora nodorum SN15]KAH3927946.1 hypothetical protein HBH54_141690 [Parastagonospora nodorum]KAH3948981.1 hypothetical protein HBH53_091670 [Parastagonospora nodorum]KAH3972395.1 hypothetical protein HBH52_153530 [Parastagonospora nodorum]
MRSEAAVAQLPRPAGVRGSQRCDCPRSSEKLLEGSDSGEMLDCQYGTADVQTLIRQQGLLSDDLIGLLLLASEHGRRGR